MPDLCFLGIHVRGVTQGHHLLIVAEAGDVVSAKAEAEATAGLDHRGGGSTLWSTLTDQEAPNAVGAPNVKRCHHQHQGAGSTTRHPMREAQEAGPASHLGMIHLQMARIMAGAEALQPKLIKSALQKNQTTALWKPMELGNVALAPSPGRGGVLELMKRMTMLLLVPQEAVSE